MNSRLIVKEDGSSKRTHFICPCRYCSSKRVDTAYGYDHAKKELGWIFTSNIKYCPPGKGPVAVCKECFNAVT